MSAPTLEAYVNDRLGRLWIYDTSTLPTSLTPTSASPYNFTGGPSTAALAFDFNSTYNVYLPGGYAGGSQVVSGITYNAVNVNGVSASATPATLLTPQLMPVGPGLNGSFRPTQASYDGGSHIIAVSDYSYGLTGWSSSGAGTQMQLLTTGFAKNLFQPGSGNGAIQAQGVAVNGNVAYTCCQVSGQDTIAACNFQTGASPTLTGVTSLALSSSYTNMVYDSTHSLIFITSNSPSGGLTVLNSSYAHVTSSPFSTGGTGPQDCRGICRFVDATTGHGFIFVCNFASNTLAVFQQDSSGFPSTLIGTYATGVGPNGVACYQKTTNQIAVFVTNFNGIAGGITVYTLNTSGTASMSLVGNYLPNQQFVSIAVVGP